MKASQNKFSMVLGNASQVGIKENQDEFILVKAMGPLEMRSRFSQRFLKSIDNYLTKGKREIKSEEDVTMPFYFSQSIGFELNHLINSLHAANHDWLKENLKLDFSSRVFGTTLLARQNGRHLSFVFLGSIFIWLKRLNSWRLLNNPHSLRLRSGEIPTVPSHIQETELPLQALGLNDSPQVSAFDLQLQQGDKVFIHTDGMPGNEIESLVHLLENSNLPQEDSILTTVQPTREMRWSCVRKALSQFGHSSDENENAEWGEMKSMGVIYFEV